MAGCHLLDGGLDGTAMRIRKRAAIGKATAAGATVLVSPYTADRRNAAMVPFPGGYIAEIHAQQK